MPITFVESLRVVLATLLLLLPGLFLLPRLFESSTPRGAASWALGAGLSLGLIGLVFRLGALLHWSLTATLLLHALIGTALAILALVRRRPAGSQAPAAGAPRAATILLLAMLLAALLAAHYGAYVGMGADSWDYVNRATAILRTDRLDAPNPYDPSFHNPYDPTFYGFIASISRLSGVAPAKVWQALPIVATPLEMGVIAGVTAILSGSPLAGTAAAIFYAAIDGPFFLFRNSGHHQMLGDLLALIALAALFLHARNGKRRLVLTGALAAFAATTWHHFLLVQGAFLVGTAGLLLAFYGRRRGGVMRPLVFTVVTAAALLPAAWHIQASFVHHLDPKSMDEFFRTTIAPLVTIGPGFFPNPFHWYLQSYWHPFPMLLLLFHFGRRLFREATPGTLAWLVLIPLLLVMNPIVFPLLAKVTSLQVATRILNLVNYPGVILLGWVVAEALAHQTLTPEPATMPPQPVASGRAWIFAFLSVAAIVPQTLIRIQGDYAGNAIRKEWATSPAAWSDGLKELARRARPGQVVLSDLETSYSIPSFAPLSVVAMTREDFAFQADDAAARRSAVETFLDPMAPPDSSMAALRSWNVDWIVLNRAVTNPLTEEKLREMATRGWGVSPSFERAGLSVWSVDRMAPSPPVAGPVFDRLLIAPDIFRAFREPGTGLAWNGALGVGSVVGPDTVAVGDTLYLTLYYEWREGAVNGNLYAKLVRDDAYGTRGRWFIRQVRNSILGLYDSILMSRHLEYRHFRSRSLAAGAIFPDLFELPIGEGTSPGVYTLRVREGANPGEGNLGFPLSRITVVRSHPRPVSPQR